MRDKYCASLKLRLQLSSSVGVSFSFRNAGVYFPILIPSLIPELESLSLTTVISLRPKTAKFKIPSESTSWPVGGPIINPRRH